MQFSFRPLRAVSSIGLAAVGGAASLAFVAATWHWQMAHRVSRLATAGERLRAELSMSASAPVERPLADYTQRLPADVAVGPLVHQLQRSSAQLGVVVVSVAGAAHDATAQTLGRTDVRLTLRGNYPNLKTVLAEALDRFPGLVLQRMSLRRLASGTELEARVDLVQFSRPLASGTGG